MSTMTRTDIHSPSNFDPSEYSYVGAFDAWRDYRLPPAAIEQENRLVSLLTDHGFEGGNWSERGTCDHCGARMRYVMVYRHESGQHIATGETCADGRFELSDRAAYDRKALAGLAAAAREAAAREASILATLEANPGLAAALETPNDFVQDVARRFAQHGTLSERQISAVLRAAARAAEVTAERDAEVKVPAPSGRVTFSGVVVSRKFKDSDYGGAFKLTVKVSTPEGVWLVWLTEPSSIETERGDIVQMTATLTPSDNDSSFAFGKRPSKASKIGRDEIAGTASSLD